MRSSFLLLVFLLSACGSLKRSGVSSVEAVLLRSADVGDQLDREVGGARGPASLRLIAFQPPLGRLKISSPFGRRRGRRHDGVDLQANEGTPIYAVQSGIVVYASDSIDGYGKAVILRHIGGYATLYAHASALRVKKGERVARGACIAYAGSTGNATGAHLHFEVREGVKPVNPAKWLRSRKLANES